MATPIEDPPRPATGQLWRPRGPQHLIARVIAVDTHRDPPEIEYEILDEDHWRLSPRVRVVLDDSWFESFEPVDDADDLVA
jgi:hypothetical protein